MTWKDAGDCGRVCRCITNEENSQDICRVWIKQEVYFHEGMRHGWRVESWPEGEANLRLILQAPRLLEALEAILKTAQRISADTDLPTRTRTDWWAVMKRARAAIAAVKGENNEKA